MEGSDLPVEFVRALQVLDEAGGARFTYEHRFIERWRRSGVRERMREQGVGWFVLLGVLGGLFRALDAILRLGRRQRQEWPYRGSALGAVDLRNRRSLLQYGASGVSILESEGQERFGTPGRPVGAFPQHRTHPLQPLWLIDLLRGATAAEADEDERADVANSMRYRVTTDFARVVEATGADIALPPSATYRDLSRQTVWVWIDRDEQRPRRIAWRDATSEAILDILSLGDQSGIGWDDDSIPNLVGEETP